MENINSTVLEPGGDSENENFVVIDVSDEEFNSAMDNSCEDNIEDIIINKNNLNNVSKKEEDSSDEEDDEDKSDESGINYESSNLVAKEEPIIFTREDSENENVEVDTVLSSEVISVENGNKPEKEEDSSSDSSGTSDDFSEPVEDAEGDSDSNDDSDLYDSSSSGDDSDEITSDSDSDDSDDVSSDSDDSENEGENLSEDSEEAVVSDSDNSDDSSEFSGGEDESDDGSPQNMEEDEDSNSSPEMDVEEDEENKENLSEENNSSDEGKSSESSPEEIIDSPEKSDSGESSPSESEKSPMSENAGENFEDPINSNVSESEENISSPNSEGQESLPNSPRSEDEKSNSPGSPNSEKSYQSSLSDEAGSPNSIKSGDNSGSDSPRSVVSEGSPKSGSSSGSPESQNSQDGQDSLSLPSSPRSGSGSSNSGSPNSCDAGSPSPPLSPNSPCTPGSEEVNSPNLSDEAKSIGSRSNSDEENTLKEDDGISSSPGNSPESNEPTSPQSQSSSNGSKSPSEGSGSPMSINSGSPSDGSSSSDNFGSPEEYSLSPASSYEEEILSGSPQSPSSPLDNSPHDFNEENDADSENGNKSDNEEGADLVEMDFENINTNVLCDQEIEDLVEADDEDSQGSDGSASEEQWTDVESEEDENNSSDNEVAIESDDSSSGESDSESEDDSSDSWESDDSDDSSDSSDSDDYQVDLNPIPDKIKLPDIPTTEQSMTCSLNVGNFEEEGKILLVDDDSDNWEDVNSSSSEQDEEDSSENDSESDEDLEDEKPTLNLRPSTLLNAQDEIEDDFENDDNEDDWEIIDDNNNITEDENNMEDSDSSSSSSSSSEEDPVDVHQDPDPVETIEDDEQYTIFGNENEMMQTDSTENFIGEEVSIKNGIDTVQLLELMDSVKQENGSVEDFSKIKMEEYLKTTGFIAENLNEKSEKTIEAKDLAELISQQDNHLNSVSLGPDYEPEEIKNEISRFWGFYHSIKNSDPKLGEELTAFLVPMLIYFYVELIISSLPLLAIELFTLFGDKFIKEGGDTAFIKELMTLSEIKDKSEFEKNEHLESLQDRKYTFSLSVAAFEKLTKFLAKSRTPVLISLFSDRFVTKLKFPDVQKDRVEESENDIENDCDENEEDSSDSEELCFDELVDHDINRVSRAREVIRKLRSNPLITMPSVTVYTSNGRPMCGAMSAQGTMVAYGMDPAGIRLCKTAKAQHFSDEDKENENQNQPGVLNLNAHEGTVYDVAFHPKTKLLYSVGYDGFMRAWDLHKDKPSNRCVYSGHLGAIWTMDISPSGRMIATGGMDTTARLWLPERNDYVRLFVGHYFDVDCVKFHPNEAYLATGSIDKSVRLWSINDGNMVRILTGCPGRVNALAFHESGKYIAGGGEDDVIRIWDIAEGDLLYELPSELCCKDLSFYGNKLAGCFDQSLVQIWDLKKLLGGDDMSRNAKKEENESEKFFNIFGDGKSSSDEENGENGEIIIPAPYSISCNTEYVFRVNFKDAANVFCLGAEKKLLVSDNDRRQRSRSEASSSDERVVSPEEEESWSFPPLTLHDYPFLDSDHRATIACLEEEGPVDSFDYSGGYSTEAPNAMSADEIDTSEQDKVREEVETYDKLVKSTQQDDDTWLTDL